MNLDKEKLSFHHIYKRYDERDVLSDINVKIFPGEFITIMGPSGCGKTTLLRMVNLQITPTSGSIYLDEKDILSFNPISLRRRIGYAIQGALLFPNMSVEENIAFVPNLLSKKERESLNVDIDHLLNRVSLDPSFRSRYPDELSGGQQQRVSIARALAANPSLLLMDEPFSAVDEITRGELQNEIKRIQRDDHLTVLFVTHDVSEALKLGSRLLILNEGKVEQFDTPNNILSAPASSYVERLLGKNLRINAQ